MNQLTIGFPTYMRREAILARLDVLLQDPAVDGVPILVIDNGSTDGTFEAIKSKYSSPRLTLLRNPTNIGIVRNLTRLFRECQTDYLLLMSDEDELITEGFTELIDCLEKHHPLFISPQALIGEQVYRGRDCTGLIDSYDFSLASFYISGLVYHRESTCRHIDNLDWLEASSTAARLYPLVILALELMLEGDTYWLRRPLARKRQDLPTLIFDTGGNSYAELPSRWRQHTDLLRYLSERGSNSSSPRVLELLTKMRTFLYHQLYERVLTAIQYECAESAEAFRAGALFFEEKHSSKIRDLETKLENFRGMIQRRDEKIAGLESRLSRMK